MTMMKVEYTKYFWLREKAEAFIAKHKKQECFVLEFKNLHWRVTKLIPYKD